MKKSVAHSFHPKYIWVNIIVTIACLGMTALTNKSISDLQLSIRTTQSEYSVKDTIGVQYAGMPGNKLDWVAISRKGSPNTDYIEWRYTDGTAKGILLFKPLPPGNYEARLYFDWGIGGGGYLVQAKYDFFVR